MSSEVAAVFTLGNTEAQVLFALEQILQTEGQKPHLYILYGEAAPQQVRTPLDAVAALQPKLAQMGLSVEFRSTPAFSPDACYERTVEVLREVSRAGYHKVYLGITGATNPMVAALFHGGMTELSGEVIPIYVQGKQTEGGHQSIEMFRAARTQDDIAIERALTLARLGHLGTAASRAGESSQLGPVRFLREALELLHAWDQFDYSVAKRMGEMADRCADQSAGRLAAIANTLQRYIPIAKKVSEVEPIVRDADTFRREAGRPGWTARIEERGLWLPLDALANAHRRRAGGACTDAAMRAYRAVELALHYRLFLRGVHPSALDWKSEPLAQVALKWQDLWGEPPKVVAFEHAARLLELLDDKAVPGTSDPRRNVQSVRNSCYLEHGYVRVDDDACAKALDKARTLCKTYLGLGDGIDARLKQLTMEF